MADLVVILAVVVFFTICYGVVTLLEQLPHRESGR